MTDTALIERAKQTVKIIEGNYDRHVDLFSIDMQEFGVIHEMLEALEQSEWERVLIERLVVLHILSPEHETNPSKALHDIISYEVLISLDPLVSSDAVDLIEKYGGTYPPAEVEI